VECDAVEVGYGLIDVYGRGTMPQSARLVLKTMGSYIPRESFGKHRLNEGVLVVKKKHRGGLCRGNCWCPLSGSSWSLVDDSDPRGGAKLRCCRRQAGGQRTT
jgi:hypothetical protein